MAGLVHYHQCSGAKGKAMNWYRLEANWTDYADAARALPDFVRVSKAR